MIGKTKPDLKRTPKQIAWGGTWAIFAISQLAGLRSRFRFRWNFDEELLDGIPELGIYERDLRNPDDRKTWGKYDPDYVIGMAEGKWYAYGFFATFSNSEGPGCDEVHIGDFESLEEALFGILGYLAKNILDGISEARWDRQWRAYELKA